MDRTREGWGGGGGLNPRPHTVSQKITQKIEVLLICRHEERNELSFYFFLFFKLSLLKIFCLGKTLQAPSIERKKYSSALGFQGIDPHDSGKRRSSACVSWCGGVMTGVGSCRNSEKGSRTLATGKQLLSLILVFFLWGVYIRTRM